MPVSKALLVVAIMLAGVGASILLLVWAIRGSVRASEAAALIAKRHELLTRGERGPLTAEDLKKILGITEALRGQTRGGRIAAALEDEISNIRAAQRAFNSGDLSQAKERLALVGRRMVRL